MTELFQDRLPIHEFDARVKEIEDDPGHSFRAWVEIAGIDPSQDLRFGDFSDCSMDADDLRGFNFTGCNLRNTTFKNAQIEAAIFDLASLGLAALEQAADFDAWLTADLARPPNTRRRINPARLPDLASFREAPFAPEMVVIPAGEFLMGSDDSDNDAFADEKTPDGKKRKIVIPERFALGKYPVTFDEYLLFCAATKRREPRDFDWGRDRRPVVDVSWRDANAYADWLNEKLGVEAYGLPSETQFEYACRARTGARYWWGDDWDPSRANGNREFVGGRTSPVGQFGENPFKLADMSGNVWEWQADVWTDKLAGLPGDGAPCGPPVTRGRKRQTKTQEAPARALRGGSWSNYPRSLRAAFRDDDRHPGNRNNHVGFRLSRTLRS
jgi:formylglycine-generating enzyme required for sulfatase activity